MFRTSLAAVALLLAGTGAIAAAIPANIQAAPADPARSADQAKDATRHGPEILAFAGVRSGAKVADLIPGGGYWTRLLARSVGSSGHVYGVWPAEYAKVDDDDVGPYKALAAQYPNVSVLDEPAAAFTAPEKLDLVFTSQNVHDYPDKFMGHVDPADLGKAVFAALKPGGVFLIVDHAADAGSGLRDTDTLHRIDPATVKADMAKAGFVFAGESKLLANSADNHRLKVFDKAIRGHTDQFVYKFRKPGHSG
jgi:predicted methyltransferase